MNELFNANNETLSAHFHYNDPIAVYDPVEIQNMYEIIQGRSVNSRQRVNSRPLGQIDQPPIHPPIPSGEGLDPRTEPELF